MPDSIPFPAARLMIPPKREWPFDLQGRYDAVPVVGVHSRLPLFWVAIRYIEGRPDTHNQATALRAARSMVNLHNAALALHRRAQARNRATRLKLIKEKLA